MGNTKLGQRFHGLPQLTCFLIDVVHAMRVAAHQHFCGRDTIHHSLFQWIDDGTVKTLCDCHYHERLVDELALGQHKEDVRQDAGEFFVSLPFRSA